MIDVTLSNPQGSGEGVASLPAGQLGAQATGTGSGFGVLSQGVDVFTVGGLNPGTVVPVTATLTANGNGLITIPGASGGTMVQIGQFGGSQDFQQKVFQAGNNAPTNTPFPIGLGASTNFNAIDGTPFSLDYFLRLDVNNGTTFDFLHTGRLSFTLPFGATISSDGGFSVAPVPEPTTGVLFASSLAGLGIWRWRKWSGLWRSSRTNED